MVSKTSKSQMITARLPHDLVEQIDQYRAKIQAGMPGGTEFNRADAVRALLTAALEAEERKSKKR